MNFKIIDSFFRYFTHPSIAIGSLDYTRNLMRLSSVSITGTASFIYMFICFFFDYFIGVYVCLFLSSYHLFLLYSIKYKRFSDEGLAHFSGIFSSIAINVVVCTTGGPLSPIAFWMLASIIYAFWMAGLRTGLLWSVIFLFEYLIILFLETSGIVFPNYFPEHFISLFYYLIFLGLFCYIAMMLVFFDIWKKAVINELNALNFTKDRMITMIGHDLKNPLNILMTQAQIMDNTKAFDEKHHESSKCLLNRMKRIIENMMVFERIETGKLESLYGEIDLDKLLQELLLEYSYHSKTYQIKLDYKMIDKISFENIDRVNLERILSNLISNALKYSPKNSTVTINTFKKEDKAIIQIKDEGIGIEKEQMKKLFQIYQKGPYSPLMKKEDSNGIGLYIVKELCQKIGAEINVYSEGKDRGCEFTLTIPLS